MYLNQNNWTDGTAMACKALSMIRERILAYNIDATSIGDDSYFTMNPFVCGRERGIALTFVKSPWYSRKTLTTSNGKPIRTMRVRRAERTIVLCTDRGTDALRVYYGGKDSFTPFENQPKDWNKYVLFSVGQGGKARKREWNRAATQCVRFLFTNAKPTGTPRSR